MLRLLQRFCLLLVLTAVSLPAQTLIDRLHRPGDAGGIPAHSFAAATRLWLGGDATRAQVVTLFTLTPTQETQLDEIKATFDAQLTNIEKLSFQLKLEGIVILLQEDLITEAQAKTLFGMQ